MSLTTINKRTRSFTVALSTGTVERLTPRLAYNLVFDYVQTHSPSERSASLYYKGCKVLRWGKRDMNDTSDLCALLQEIRLMGEAKVVLETGETPSSLRD